MLGQTVAPSLARFCTFAAVYFLIVGYGTPTVAEYCLRESGLPLELSVDGWRGAANQFVTVAVIFIKSLPWDQLVRATICFFDVSEGGLQQQ